MLHLRLERVCEALIERERNLSERAAENQAEAEWYELEAEQALERRTRRGSRWLLQLALLRIEQVRGAHEHRSSAGKGDERERDGEIGRAATRERDVRGEVFFRFCTALKSFRLAF